HTRCLSDWSSDVCSSDLLNPSLSCPLFLSQIAGSRSSMTRNWGSYGISLAHDGPEELKGRSCIGGLCELKSAKDVGNRRDQGPEIGRASCRERGEIGEVD